MLSNFYQQIQIIMTFLGYYEGNCDGVWGPKSIAAKRVWEFDDSFEPAVPSNGLPFTGRDRLPKGLVYMRKGLEIVCLKMSNEAREKILEEKGCLITASDLEDLEKNAVPKKPVAVVAPVHVPKVSVAAEPKIDTPIPIEDTPIATAIAESEIEDEEDEEDDPTPVKKDWTQQRKNK